HTLLLCSRHGLTDPVPACGLDLTGEAANIVLKLPELVVAIIERLLEPFATHLVAFDFGGIGCVQPQCIEGGGSRLKLAFRVRYLGNEGRMPRRPLRIGAKGQVLGDGFAKEFELGFGGAAFTDRGFERLLLLRTRLIKIVTACLERSALLR